MTKLRLTNLAPAAVALTLIGGAFAALSTQDDAPAQEGAAGQETEAVEKHSELHESMERLQKSQKALRKLMRKPEQKAEAIKLCVEMEAAALEGFLHPPTSPDGLEGSELLAYQADFKKRMLAVAGVLVDFEVALDAGDDDKAKELFRALGAQKTEGHEIYEK